MEKRRVVVTGMGMLTPLGNTVAETWMAAKEGHSGVAPITQFDASEMPSQIAGEVKGFDPLQFIEKKELKKIDLFSIFAIAAASEAVAEAGIAQCDYDPARMGCVLGVGIGGLGVLEKYHAAYLEGGPRKITPFLIPAMISNLAAGNLGIRFGFKGVNFVTTSACASSTHALGEAYRMVAEGMQDVVLSGGAESTVTPIGIGGFCAMKALSTRNDEPERASRPFDRDRDGFVLSEGSVVMVLEPLEAAKRRGAPIYAEILGYGSSCDAYHITAPCTDGAGAAQCMEMALRNAKLNPSDITLVNAHGTSTSAGDVAETIAIKRVFGEYAKNGLMVNATKSMTGHLLGAAGAIEAGLSILSVRDDVIPPTINLDNPDEGCDLDYVPHTAREIDVNVVMSNSFGFGGTNGTIIVGKPS